MRLLAYALLSVLFLSTPYALAQPPELGDEAARQIAALMREKQSRTPAQLKIDSQLLLEMKKLSRDSPLADLPNPARLLTGVRVQPDGTVMVDVRADVTEALLTYFAALGGKVINAHAKFDAVRAHLPFHRLEEIARRPDIHNIRPADESQIQMINTTEGDIAHGSDLVRLNLGIDGTGVKVGIISNGVEALVDLQNSGDLPPVVTILPGQAGSSGSAGTAMMEIVHDMAPGAELFFATGTGGVAQMAQNIDDLVDAGCDIIVDDFLYFAEPAFQDGTLAIAVDNAAAAGVMFFSALTNSGNLKKGTAGVWEGDYVGTALPAPLAGMGLTAHDFDPIEGGANSNVITEPEMTPAFVFSLQWNDPWGASGNDYDLFLLDPTLTNIVASSTNTQNGDDDPFEQILSIDDHTDHHLVIVKTSGEDRFVRVNTHRGLLQFATNGQIYGHAAAEGAMAVAAVDVATANGGQFTGGAANPVEDFSSDGPRRIFFNPDGSPVAPARQGRGTTSVVRPKPDVAAANGVSTATPGFNPFFGTSASAPHSAGIAALFDELFPSVSVLSAYDLFRSAALDIEDPGFDNESGAGIMMLEDPMDNVIFADGFESGDTSSWSN